MPKPPNKPKQSIGILFIRWNIYNRIAVSVAYFENGKMKYMIVDKSIIKKICNNFIKDVDVDFVSEYPNAFKKKKINEASWNEQAIQQNGLLEIKKTSVVGVKMSKNDFNDIAKHYLIQ